jgi:hypothetical protein
LYEKAVAGGLDEPTAILGDPGIDQFASMVRTRSVVVTAFA